MPSDDAVPALPVRAIADRRWRMPRMSKPLSKRELLEMQIRTYEFYADLIDRAVGGSQVKMPKWDDQRALEYKMLADELRSQLAQLDAAEANLPAIDPGVTKQVRTPEDASPSVASPESG
jgi:hypothetical protein